MKQMMTSNQQAALLDDFIHAGVMERYYRGRMAELDQHCHDTVDPHLDAYDPEASEVQQRDFLTHLHAMLNAPSYLNRNCLLHRTTDSPNLLAFIKPEGRI